MNSKSMFQIEALICGMLFNSTPLLSSKQKSCMDEPHSQYTVASACMYTYMYISCPNYTLTYGLDGLVASSSDGGLFTH